MGGDGSQHECHELLYGGSICTREGHAGSEMATHVDGDDVAAADKLLEVAEVLGAHGLNLWLLVAVVVDQLDAKALHRTALSLGKYLSQ